MIITQTPLRISLFGGGTDIPWFYQQEGGCVLSTAIDKYIYVVVKERFDAKIRVGYSQTELVEDVNDLQHELIRECLKLAHIPTFQHTGVEITTMADIPSEGSGLGSSSAVTVGTLNALYAFQGWSNPAWSVAKDACLIEIGKLHKTIGKQDQYIAALGGLRFMEFWKDGNVAHEKFQLSKEVARTLNESLLLFFTGITRKAEDFCPQKAAVTTPFLRKIKELALVAKEVVLSGTCLNDLGELLHESWEHKKQLGVGVTTPLIDAYYDAARQAGALGGKITGAGGGGFLLLYVPYLYQNTVRKALAPLQELPFRLEPEGSKVILNYGHNGH